MTFKTVSVAAILACAAFAAAPIAQPQTPSPAYAGPVAAVVSIPIPPGLTRDKIETLFRQQAPVFAGIPTLKQKYFTINDETRRAGGVYLWVNAEAAHAFYNDAWRARVKAAYGADAEITWFDAPVIIQGKAGMAQ